MELFPLGLVRLRSLLQDADLVDDLDGTVLWNREQLIGERRLMNNIEVHASHIFLID